MGYAFVVYRIDLARLQALWGSGDAKVLAAVKRRQAAALARNATWFASRIAEGAPTIETALDDIFAGTVTRRRHAYQYGYALEVLCQQLGTRVDDESLSWFDELLDPLLKRHRKPRVATLLGRHARPFAIPKAADFPEIGTIDAAGIATLAAALDAIEPTIDEDEDDDAREVVDEVRRWLASARRSRRQICWFVY